MMPVVLKTLMGVGRHCANSLLDSDLICNVALEALRRAGGTPVGRTEHFFVPHGLTVVAIASESHLAVSTWPEYRAIAVDITLCGTDVDPKSGWNHIVDSLGPIECSYDLAERPIS
jgi:S-adenosylmethionine decarboxylase proenzyme